MFYAIKYGATNNTSDASLLNIFREYTRIPTFTMQINVFDLCNTMHTLQTYKMTNCANN